MTWQPEDQRLVTIARHIAEATAIGLRGAGAIHFIDRDYEITTVTDQRAATRMRQRFMMGGKLLAVVMTGWSDTEQGQVVCQYFPAPGVAKTYMLTYPAPEVSWADPEDPKSLAIFGAYGEIWHLQDLEAMDPSKEGNDE